MKNEVQRESNSEEISSNQTEIREGELGVNVDYSFKGIFGKHLLWDQNVDISMIPQKPVDTLRFECAIACPYGDFVFEGDVDDGLKLIQQIKSLIELVKTKNALKEDIKRLNSERDCYGPTRKDDFEKWQNISHKIYDKEPELALVNAKIHALNAAIGKYKI